MMPLSEFSLIERFFTQSSPRNAVTRLGIGDDCALLAVPAGHELAVTTDTLVENVHFFGGDDPAALGHKALAVNLSDLASMGAKPVAATLALTLAQVDEDWLAAFSRGFLDLARQYNVDLIGGDTTGGPLTLTVQALGILPQGTALRRCGAKPGDFIYLTGDIGDAGLGLKICHGYVCNAPDLPLLRLHRPTPQVANGLALRGTATACIDVSDGLTGDLGHILKQSRVGARLDWSCLPLSDAVLAYIADTGDWALPLTAGDDYELCFTVHPNDAGKVPDSCRKIGVIEQEPGLRLHQSGLVRPLTTRAYEHFS